MLQKQMSTAITWLKEIFRGCIWLNCVWFIFVESSSNSLDNIYVKHQNNRGNNKTFLHSLISFNDESCCISPNEGGWKEGILLRAWNGNFTEKRIVRVAADLYNFHPGRDFSHNFYLRPDLLSTFTGLLFGSWWYLEDESNLGWIVSGFLLSVSLVLGFETYI